MSQGLVYFNGVNFLGGEMTFSRGVSPSICTLRYTPQLVFDRVYGTLQFIHDGVAIAFPNAAVVENSSRYYHGREGWRWSIQVADRRWKWRYYYVNGVYNERAVSGTIQTTGKKNAKELVEILLTAMGESGYDTTAVSEAVYPPVVWNRARASNELQWLCDLLGLVVVLRQDNTVRICKLNDAAGYVLPGMGYVSPPLPNWKSAVIPQNLRVQGNPSIFQSKLTLEPVGLETDGGIEPIADLSYKPAGGWGAEWPGLFTGVSASYRDLALRSVYRWYRPTTGWDEDGVTISDYKQLELLPYSAETADDASGVHRNLPSLVSGDFWPYGDLDLNVTDQRYAGNFTILPQTGVVEFECPVFKIKDNDEVESPTLYLTTGYRVRKSDSDGYAVYTKDKAVSSANQTTGYRVLHHPELTKTKIFDAIYGAAGDNKTDLDTEADVYLNGTEATYDFANSRDIVYNAIVKQDLDGALAQIKWWCGNGRVAMTRIGHNTEFDIFQQHAQQRRAMERLAQMAERLGI